MAMMLSNEQHALAVGMYCGACDNLVYFVCLFVLGWTIFQSNYGIIRP